MARSLEARAPAGYASSMPRCMICAKDRPDEEVSGGICRACSDAVRREAAGDKRRERQSSDKALRSHGQEPKRPGKPRR